MKTPLNIIAILMLALCGCTHNNGNIGPWYGQWKLEALEVDGREDPAYGHNQFWAFQNDILVINEVMSETDHLVRYATWRQEGEMLLIDFSHSDADTPSSDVNYTPPPILGLKPQAVNALKIESLGHGRTVLTYDTGDRLITYRLRKWG